MNFEAEALKLLTEIKSQIGGLNSSMDTNTKTIENHAFRLAWLERFFYGGVAIVGFLAFLFPHAGVAIAHLLNSPPQDHSDPPKE